MAEKTCILCGGPLQLGCDGVCKACLLRQGDEYVRTGMSGVWNKIIGPVLMAITGTYHYLLNDDTVTGSIWIVGAIIVLVLSDR